MKKLVAIAAICLPTLSSAECHIGVPAAIFCATPTNAAEAFVSLGADSNRIRTSNMRAFLREHGCIVNESKQTLEQYGNERSVPLPSQWVPIKAISAVGAGDLWYVASSYISGTCRRYIPSNGQVAPHSSDPLGPTYQHYDMPQSGTP